LPRLAGAGDELLAPRHKVFGVSLVELSLRLGQQVRHAGRISSMASIVPSGKGRRRAARGNVMAFKAVAAQTGGDFSLMERTVPPGARTPPPHRHVNLSEAFFVLDRTITFWLDEDSLTGGAGDFLL